MRWLAMSCWRVSLMTVKRASAVTRVGPDARAARLVDDTASAEHAIPGAVSRLQLLLGTDRGTLGAIKTTMYSSVTTALRTVRD